MTLAELEFELVKRGVTMSSPLRHAGLWYVSVNDGERCFGVSSAEALEDAVRGAIADFDAENAKRFCVGEA